MESLRVAIVEIAQEDTGTGGLVELTGNASPLIMRSTLGDATTPRITGFSLPSGEGTKKASRTVQMQFVAWVHPHDTEQYVVRAERIRDRLKERLSATHLLAKGVAAAPINPRWFDVDAEQGDATIGLGLELTFMNVT